MIDTSPKQPVTNRLEQPLGKAQTVRLGDVFILGPTMIWLGLKKKPLSEGEKLFLITTGIGTVIYNYANYRSEDRRIAALIEVEKERLKKEQA